MSNIYDMKGQPVSDAYTPEDFAKWAIKVEQYMKDSAALILDLHNRVKKLESKKSWQIWR